MTRNEKIGRVCLNTVKICAVFLLLYFFICSLDLLSSAFKLIAGQSTSDLVGNPLISNPIVGLMVGILLTVLVQSSSTSTSIVLLFAVLSVHYAIPIIMGANIGTSVTNTLVSLTQVGEREQFRKAFAGATVHDMFNWLSVLVLLPLEIMFGLLEKLTGAIVTDIMGTDGGDIKLLKAITEPFTDLIVQVRYLTILLPSPTSSSRCVILPPCSLHRLHRPGALSYHPAPFTDFIVQIDSGVFNCWSLGEWLEKKSILVQFCEYYDNYTTTATTLEPTTTVNLPSTTLDPNATEIHCPEDPNHIGIPGTCHYLFYETKMTDQQVGTIVLVMSLVMLCGALIIIVKLLNSMLKGSMAIVIKKTLNADIPYVPWITGYIAILIGAVMTFIIQSSSIFTSTLTPLIGEWTKFC
ncbi:hypothetical protein HAZT_HAZT006730 [Hyalella azteca]|uniref:Sodium-dependent phosphate transport protein 2B n=1 Tax=Hyalella azteca TaxID=294128 RepID=A0A6A0H4A4_HYAAZ|nr:hypothetical protein HAZT_HAZT006730 [Hyalella azteca]